MGKSPCQVCRDLVPEISKRFDENLGFVCLECHGFLALAPKRLRRVGIEGCAVTPVRYAPKPETETP